MIPESLKNTLFGNWQRQDEKRNNLALKAAHKALDIPEDDMNIRANTTHIHGIGPVGLLAAVLGASVLPATLAGYMLLKQPAAPAAATDKPAVTPTTTVEPAKPLVWDEVEQIQQADGSWKATGKKVRKRIADSGTVETQQPDGTWLK